MALSASNSGGGRLRSGALRATDVVVMALASSGPIQSVAASLAAILESRGLKVTLIKLDPYLNVDPGTMSPFQHGEVFVTDDGAETDLDLGHYERFTGRSANQSDNITTGRVYKNIIDRERRGDYLGATVQVIPHVTDAIKEFITSDIQDEDFILCEIGGTVGDIESLPFLEAIRQLGQELDPGQAAFVHLTLLPYIGAAGELKTKPTQHTVQKLREIGIQPDVLLCRADHPLAAQRTVTWRQLHGHRLVSLKSTSSVRHLVEAALIDPALPVDRQFRDFRQRELGYWSSYSLASERGRAAYLAWLADGRQAIIIADVSGEALSGALYMARLGAVLKQAAQRKEATRRILGVDELQRARAQRRRSIGAQGRQRHQRPERAQDHQHQRRS